MALHKAGQGPIRTPMHASSKYHAWNWRPEQMLPLAIAVTKTLQFRPGYLKPIYVDVVLYLEV